jgi:hypothetical protein
LRTAAAIGRRRRLILAAQQQASQGTCGPWVRVTCPAGNAGAVPSIVRQYGQVLEGQAGELAIRRLEEAVRRLRTATAGRERRGLHHDDADDVAGTAATDDAIGFNPLPLLRALHEHGAVVAVMGQVAGIMHGSDELTGDLDLLWDGDRGQAPALAAAFAAAGASLADDQGRPVPCDPAAFALPKVLFRSALASGDCCTPALPWGGLPIAGFLARCQLAAAPDGLVIRYLDRADLIRMRRATGRPKDLRRARELEQLAPAG